MRREVVHTSSAERGDSACQEGDDVGVALFAREVDGGAGFIVGGMGIGAVVEEQAHELQLAVLGRLVQRGNAGLLARVDICTGGYQEVRDGVGRPGQGGVYGRYLEGVTRVGIDFGAASQQQLDGLALTKERGQLKGLESVGRPGVDGGGIGAQELFEAGADAKGGGLVDGQRFGSRVGGQTPGLVGAAVVEGIHDR
jgi:hypothetical protein